ncbi:MAG: hypothetical protein KAG91_00530 [Mycoplasmataceae bacterium]|nr:hypothetical protein [Mycoplasmataceae bacterium]
MKHKSIVYEITLSGFLVSIGIIIGAFATFHIFGGAIYLVGIVAFLMPIILRFRFSIISVLITVIITDLINGYIIYVWITLIAYTVSTIIIWMFSKLRLKLLFIPGLILASISVISVYFFMEALVFDRAMAIKDMYANLVQFAIIIPVVSLLYTPILLLK